VLTWPWAALAEFPRRSTRVANGSQHGPPPSRSRKSWIAAGPRQGTLHGIAANAQPEPLPLPRFEPYEPERFPFGARTEAAAFVGELLCETVPDLCSGEEPSAANSLEIVAIARRPGVLTKVAIRPRPGAVTPIVVGIGADALSDVSRQLDGERIQVVRWQRSAAAYIADALGLAEVPPMLLLPGISHARVLLGEIDVRGLAGWRGLNTILASALTGWRIRLEPVAATPGWTRLQSAMFSRRPVTGTVVGRTERGPRLDILGLYAVLSGVTSTELAVGQELQVRITRMDPDEGRIFASERLAQRAQLPLL
jgi:N utilization substance protein A